MRRQDRIRRIVSEVVYNGSYTILYGVVLCLLIASQADVVYQSIRTNQIYNAWIISVANLITILVVVFVYATRVYIHRQALAAIPRIRLPISRTDVSRSIFRQIQKGFRRSALIAHAAKPHANTTHASSSSAGASAESRPTTSKTAASSLHPQHKLLRGTATDAHATTTLKIRENGHRRHVQLPQLTLWENTEHDGWSSPNHPTHPSVHFASIYTEFPAVLETCICEAARTWPYPMHQPTLLRTAHQSLREYVLHLSQLQVLDIPATEDMQRFFDAYERARYSTRPISTATFALLTSQFATLLRMVHAPPYMARSREDISEEVRVQRRISHVYQPETDDPPNGRYDRLDDRLDFLHPYPSVASLQARGGPQPRSTSHLSLPVPAASYLGPPSLASSHEYRTPPLQHAYSDASLASTARSGLKPVVSTDSSASYRTPTLHPRPAGRGPEYATSAREQAGRAPPYGHDPRDPHDVPSPSFAFLTPTSTNNTTRHHLPRTPDVPSDGDDESLSSVIHHPLT